MPDVPHDDKRYANNFIEASHRPTREQERQMKRFKSPSQAQQFLSVHAQVNSLFRCARHLVSARVHRRLRAQAFERWQQVTCAS